MGEDTTRPIDPCKRCLLTLRQVVRQWHKEGSLHNKWGKSRSLSSGLYLPDQKEGGYGC